MPVIHLLDLSRKIKTIGENQCDAPSGISNESSESMNVHSLLNHRVSSVGFHIDDVALLIDGFHVF